MTAHAQYTGLMSLALDREITPSQDEILQAHLMTCPTCAALWAEWQAVDAEFEAAPMLTPPPGLALGVAARIEERGRRRSRARWFGAGLLIAWLACAALVLLLTVAGVWWGLAHPLQASVALSAGAHLLSGILWPVRSMEVAFAGAGISLWVGVGGYLALTGALLGLWLWLASRQRTLVTVRVQ
jgi:anti-sigma factor RsiW